MNRKHDRMWRTRAWLALRASVAGDAGGRATAGWVRLNSTALARCCVVAATLLGAVGPALVAAEPSDRFSSETRGYDAPARPSSRVMSRQTETSQREPIDAEPAYEEVPPSDPRWQAPLDEWSDGYDDSCADGESCGCVPGIVWGRADALYWWVSGSETPALLTTSPNGTAMGNAGVLPNAEILFGDQRLNGAGRFGGRFTLGYWLDPYGVGIEDTFLFLGNAGQSFSASSTGSPILARPFFNTDTNRQDAFLLAFPNFASGSTTIQSSSDVVGNEINFRRALYVDCRLRFDCLVGYRLLQLTESLEVHSNSTALEDATPPAGTKFAVQDTFDTRNQFNGGQIGFKLQQTNGCFFFDVVGKFAIGGVSQRVLINGSTVTTPPGGLPTTNTGGILALGSNIGTYQQTRVGYLPELNLNMGYHITPQWKVNFGYTFIYFTNVVRPGDEIDVRLDPSQFPPGVPGASPKFAFRDTDIWLQGINFGIERSF